MKALEILVLTLSGLSILGTGIVGLTDPQALFTPLGVDLIGASAHNEMRAAYGGMHIGVGGLLLAGAGRASMRTTALLVAAVFLGGLAVGRFVSLLLDGAPSPFVYQLWIPEAIGAVASGALLSLRTRQPK